MRRSLCCLLFLTTSLGAVRPVAADPEGERRSSFVQGRRAMEAERWAEALVIYRRLWAEQPAFDVALQLGLVEFNLRKYRDAAEHLAFGIRTIPVTEKPATAERARKLLALAEREVALLEIGIDRENAEVRIDGALVGRSPLVSEVYVEPGAHRIGAVLEGHAPVEQVVQAKAGERKQVNLELTALPRTNPEPPLAVGAALPPGSSVPLHQALPPRDNAERGKDMVPVYLAAAVGAVGLGLGVTLLAIAGGKDSDKDEALARLPGTQPCARNTPHVRECDRIGDLARDARTLRGAGAVAVGVGVLAAGTAVVLLAWPDDEAGTRAQTRAPRLAVLPQLGPRGSGASLVGEF